MESGADVSISESSLLADASIDTNHSTSETATKSNDNIALKDVYFIDSTPSRESASTSENELQPDVHSMLQQDTERTSIDSSPTHLSNTAVVKGGYARITKSRLYSPTVSALHQQWTKDKLNQDRQPIESSDNRSGSDWYDRNNSPVCGATSSPHIIERGGYSRTVKSRLYSPTASTVNQQWSKEKREPEKKWIAGHVNEPSSPGIVVELPPPPLPFKRFEQVQSRLLNSTTATVNQRKSLPAEPKKIRDDPIADNSHLLHITAAVRNGSRERVEEKRTIHAKSFCPAASPAKVI